MDTAELVFVASEPSELAGLAARCKELDRLAWPVDYARAGKLNGRGVVLLAHGVGRRRAEAAVRTALQLRRPAAVVSIGYCGALSGGLAPGDIFVGTQLDVGGRRFPLPTPAATRRFTPGVLVSVDRVAQTAAEKRALRESGAAAVEMEAAGVLQAAAAQAPVFCIRSVTDLPEESFLVDLNRALSDGHFQTSVILRQALRRPTAVFPELVRLRRRCQIASQNLGAFLADCRF